jgi:hypothetical protein
MNPGHLKPGFMHFINTGDTVANYCAQCGHALPLQAEGCPQCGAKVVEAYAEAEPLGFGQEADKPEEEFAFSTADGEALGDPVSPRVEKAKGYRWGWVLKSAAIIFSLQVLFGVLWWGLSASGMDILDENTLFYLVILLSPLAIVVGSFIAAYLSPGKTIMEPAMGAGLVVVVSNLLSGNIGGMLLGWVVPFLLGLVGAYLGEKVQERKEAGRRGGAAA